MSRRHPIFIFTDSEEEPSEGSYDSSATSAHQPTLVPITSDDTSVETPVVSPVSPVITPPVTSPVTSPILDQTHPMYAETSRMRRAPGIVIRDFPVGPSEPRDKGPMVEDERETDEPAQKRLRVAHLGWMPHLLREWRVLERIPSTYEIGESSHASPSLPLTREPVELTIPTLVAVIRTIFTLHQGTSRYIRELYDVTSRLDRDVGTIYGRLHATETSRVVDRFTLDAHRTRLEYLERRDRRMSMMMGFGVLMTLVRLIMMMYFHYFH